MYQLRRTAGVLRSGKWTWPAGRVDARLVPVSGTKTNDAARWSDSAVGLLVPRPFPALFASPAGLLSSTVGGTRERCDSKDATDAMRGTDDARRRPREGTELTAVRYLPSTYMWLQSAQSDGKKR